MKTIERGKGKKPQKIHRLYPRVTSSMYLELCIVAKHKGINLSELSRLAIEQFLRTELEKSRSKRTSPAA
jgi:hypothetical protein